MKLHMTVRLDHCPLCRSSNAEPHSLSTPNLYSEKLAELLEVDETRLLERHANWRCQDCGLLYKRHWFTASTLKTLFQDAVASHPKGWDTLPGRFSPVTFMSALESWISSINASWIPGIRRGERELLSIVDSILQPSGFAPEGIAAAVTEGNIDLLRQAAPVISSSIGEPAPFKRFAGFSSVELWDYLKSRVGLFDHYAEIGCPLWGLLTQAAKLNVRSTYLRRDEPNYWGKACTDGQTHCLVRLLENKRITSACWSAPDRYPIIGLFQYLDHLLDPGTFLKELFARSDAAAIIMDGMDAPLAIQHLTGWSDECFARVASNFGKRLHQDFEAIRPSGNKLYLMAGQV